jgi:hypothetical protein
LEPGVANTLQDAVSRWKPARTSEDARSDGVSGIISCESNVADGSKRLA